MKKSNKIIKLIISVTAGLFLTINPIEGFMLAEVLGF